MTKYNECVKLLTSKEKFHIELGLNRVSRILELFDNPQNKIKTIHIAGTNGKGSTCAILNSILTESGFKTGLFTSPHLEKYNERIQINSIPISDEYLYSLIEEVNEKAKVNNIYLTEFELITVIGFLYFARENADIAIIEVGLGGRLDATNVIKKPLITAITSISLDHTDRLGSTIEEIAKEKAGIIKDNVPCVVLDKNNGYETIKKIAINKNAKIIDVSINTSIQNIDNKNYVQIKDNLYEFALKGHYQAENLSLALAVINELKEKKYEISEESIKNGLKNVCHNGRFDYIKELNLVIDGAHNPDGALVLRKSLNTLFENNSIHFVYASINTKDYNTILSTLVTSKDEITFLNFEHNAAVNFEELKKNSKYMSSSCITKSELKELITKNKKENKITVITGSLYAIGEIYSIIKKIAQLGNIQ